MKLQYLLFSLALLASAASFSIPERFPEHGNASLQEQADSHSRCKCSDGRCVTDNRGNVKCVCKPGYALQEEFTCKPCDCGEKGQCIFTWSPRSRGGSKYEKTCVCDVGSAEKDGNCIDCYCGENSACEFDGEEKHCYCIEGYSEKDGICTECDCGFYGTCEFKEGIRQCTCDEGFLELNGICEECDCGDHGTCNFRDGTKYCQCKDMFKDNEGTCEECDCGENSVECSFSGGKKVCTCNEGFSEKNGLCEVCDCGLNSFGCNFQENQKNCACQPDYVQKGDTCAVACSFDRPCRNGGNCSDGHCSCLPGTRGEFCDIIDRCESLCPQQSDVTCSYDVKRHNPYCQCLGSDLSFDDEKKQCQRTCDEKERYCVNGGECAHFEYGNFCRCKVGTEGDFCDIVPECEDKSCGEEATCVYDVESSRAVCQCYDGLLSYDARDKRCKKACNESVLCENGGKCTDADEGSYCVCKTGTEGDLCDVVTDCPNKDCGNEANCVYNVTQERAVCRCEDNELSLDPEQKICKKTCTESVLCENGGKCSDADEGSYCGCKTGTEGDFCDVVTDCQNMDCGNEATCVYDLTQERAVCRCNDPELSFDPNDKMCKQTCDYDDSCKNGGRCGGTGPSKFCECLPGTSGDFCEKVVVCDFKDCGSDAECVYSVEEQAAVCSCRDEELNFDQQSNKCRRTCDLNDTCSNGGECAAGFCLCPVGTSGDHCDVVPECETKDCGSDAECTYSLERRSAVCACVDGRRSFDDTDNTCKTCDCGRNSISCRYEDGKKDCVCREGYGVKKGRCQRAKCTEKRCQNGICQVVDDKEVCSCYEGYELEGDYCRKLNCSKTPCYNGTCVVRRGNREECICQDGYSLKDDVCIRGACKVTTCYGGRCDVIDGELMCVCPQNFSLQGKGCYETVCKKRHCFGGSCAVGKKKEEICTCLEGYTLVNDVCKKILCEKPCYGGQCKFIDGKEECVCPPGFSIYEDVCRENKAER